MVPWWNREVVEVEMVATKKLMTYVVETRRKTMYFHGLPMIIPIPTLFATTHSIPTSHHHDYLYNYYYDVFDSSS